MSNSAKPYIVFDVDDVLCETSVPLQQALTITTGKNIPCKDWFDFSLPTVYEVAFDKILAAFHLGNILHTPFNSQVKPLFNEVKQNFSIGVLTSRAWHPEGEAITKQAFEKEGLHVDKLIVAEHSKSKAEYFHEFGEVALYVDDNIHHIKDVAAINPNTLCVIRTQPWNVAHELTLPNMARVPCVTHIRKFL